MWLDMWNSSSKEENWWKMLLKVCGTHLTARNERSLAISDSGAYFVSE